jgi:hypothetical protein
MSDAGVADGSGQFDRHRLPGARFRDRIGVAAYQRGTISELVDCLRTPGRVAESSVAIHTKKTTLGLPTTVAPGETDR